MNEFNSATARPGTTDANGAFRQSIDINSFRLRRVKRLVDHLKLTCGNKKLIRILDVGGVKGFWEGASAVWRELPLEITIVNLGVTSVDDGLYRIRPGNACDLDYADKSFDLVHSNSVIEHLGTWDDMARMASEAARVAPHLFIQTPNFWFPIEPHYRTAFFHWLPVPIRARMLTRRARGFRPRASTISDAMRDIETVSLLSADQLTALFPDARIEHERLFGFSKSLIALR